MQSSSRSLRAVLVAVLVLMLMPVFLVLPLTLVILAPPVASAYPLDGYESLPLLLTHVLPTMVLLLVAVWPLVRGSHTLYLRDAANTHLPAKWAQAEAMRGGRLPLIDPLRDGGQPALGNPNTVPLYPDNLLYLTAPTIWSFNAHFWLHLLVAPWAFFFLARVWGLGPRAAWAA